MTDAGKGLGLTRSQHNYDRMTLLYIMDKGYPRDGLTDEYPDEFSFHEKFEKIENKLLGRNRWDVYDELQEKAKITLVSATSIVEGGAHDVIQKDKSQTVK